MKIFQINMLFMLCPLLSLAQSSVQKLTGSLAPAMEGQKINILYGDFKKLTIDSARVEQGKIQVELKNAVGQIVTLTTGNKLPMDLFRLYIADGDVSFSTKDSIKNAVVKGPKDTEDYARMHQNINKLMAERFNLMNKLNMLSGTEKKDNTGIELVAKMQALAKAERAAAYRAIDDNPDAYMALYMLKHLVGVTVSYDEMMPHFKKLSAALQNTSEGKALGEKILLVKDLRSGVTAPDFESITPEGTRLKLSEILPKAKYTFVDFWASWCAPCRAENPNVVKAYQQYGNKGLTILSVSLDTKGDLWKEAIKKDGMPWLHVSKLKGFEEPAAILYGIKKIPQNVLIDSKGKIVATNLRGYALEEKLRKLMD
jgi:thiol-disulfide isomerase/thioredoxin